MNRLILYCYVYYCINRLRQFLYVWFVFFSVFGGSGNLRILVFFSGGCFLDYVFDVYKFLQNKVGMFLVWELSVDLVEMQNI